MWHIDRCAYSSTNQSAAHEDRSDSGNRSASANGDEGFAYGRPDGNPVACCADTRICDEDRE
jgi:hypothetical protein